MNEFYMLYNENTFITEDFHETNKILDAARLDEVSAFRMLKYLNLELKKFFDYNVVKVKINIEIEDI
jgi:hypothetical protein